MAFVFLYSSAEKKGAQYILGTLIKRIASGDRMHRKRRWRETEGTRKMGTRFIFCLYIYILNTTSDTV